MACEHEKFRIEANIGRLTQVEGGPVTHYCADIRAFCAECGLAFDWVGAPWGMSFYHPTASIDNRELRAPLMPPGQKTPDGLPGYTVRGEAVQRGTND